MADVKGLGFQFALDDFGIGTSSFGYSKMLPVDYFKIDGSFVRNMVNDPIDRAMAETINRIGHIMGLKTVGEFAASDAAIDELRVLGVDFAQGYAVQRSQPLPVPLQVQRETAACLRAASRIDTPQAGSGGTPVASGPKAKSPPGGGLRVTDSAGRRATSAWFPCTARVCAPSGRTS